MSWDYKKYMERTTKAIEKTLRKNIKHKALEDIKVEYRSMNIIEAIDKMKAEGYHSDLLGYIHINVILKEANDENRERS